MLHSFFLSLSPFSLPLWFTNSQQQKSPLLSYLQQEKKKVTTAAAAASTAFVNYNSHHMGMMINRIRYIQRRDGVKLFKVLLNAHFKFIRFNHHTSLPSSLFCFSFAFLIQTSACLLACLLWGERFFIITLILGHKRYRHWYRREKKI